MGRTADSTEWLAGRNAWLLSADDFYRVASDYKIPGRD
jgi:hypothetical protein